MGPRLKQKFHQASSGRAALLGLAILLVNSAHAQNPTNTTTTVQQTNAPAQNQRRPNQTGPTTQQPPPKPGYLQNFRNHVSQGGSSVKNFFSNHLPGHKEPAPQPQAPVHAPVMPREFQPNAKTGPGTQRPSTQQPSATHRFAQGDPQALDSKPHLEDRAPLFPRTSPAPGAPRGFQPPGGSVPHKSADGSTVYVRRGADGSRQVLVDRPDGSRVFAAGSGASYVQRPWLNGDQAFLRRTYSNGGQVTQQFYRPYTYNGTTLASYAPQRYFSPSVYQWAVTARTQPVPASWNYVTSGAPWFSANRGYFTPEKSYTNPLAWLTDYLIANSLIASYNAHLKATHSASPSTSTGTATTPGAAGGSGAPAAQAAPGDAAPEVTPEVKQKVAEEVSRQMQAESQDAQADAKGKDIPGDKSGIVTELKQPDVHTFVVSSDLDLNDNQGRRCTVSTGDVLQVISAPQTDNTAQATVLASKQGECGRAADVNVNLSDLQEMQNHMRETIDQGLADRAGKSGVQGEPASFAAAAPAPEPDAAQQVQQQQKLAAAEG